MIKIAHKKIENKSDKLFLLMIVSIFVSAVAGGAVNPFLPLFIKNTLHASSNLSNWATSLCVSLPYLIGAILSPFWGRLADKYGAKPWLMRASWGTAIIYLLMTFVQNVTQLIILKMAQGLFVGLMTISGAIVVQIVPKKSWKKFRPCCNNKQYFNNSCSGHR